MNISNDIISSFVKVTAVEPEIKKETLVYGTVINLDGSRKPAGVRFNGSELITPVSSTVNGQVDDVVIVSLKNHTATVIGNLSRQSQTQQNVEDDVNTKLTNYVTTNKLESEYIKSIRGEISALDTKILNAGYIDADTLKTDYLKAIEGDIEELKADHAIIENLDSTYVKAEELETKVLDAGFIKSDSLESVYVKADELETKVLDAGFIKSDSLESTYVKAEELETKVLNAGFIKSDALDSTYAKITELDVANAEINTLKSEVSEIDTLIFGSATGNVIQTSFANSVIAQLGDAQIKSAMIESVSASKITAGDIITNNVRVLSEDEKLVISDGTIQISDGTRLRVQIGKDGVGDYSINVWDQNGVLMFSKGGITDAAIKNAIIRDDMVSDTANIHASKLNIDSLFEEINSDGTNTIKSTKVVVDEEGQTLEAAFKTVATKESVDNLLTTVSSQGSQITANTEAISTKIWQQDIDKATDEINQTTTNLSTKYSTLETELSGFKTSVGETYATKTELNDIEVGGRNYVLNSDVETEITAYYALYPLSNAKSAMQDKTIVVSFDAKKPEDGKAVDMYAYFRGASPLTPNSNKIGDVTSEYKRYHVTIEPGVNIEEASQISIHPSINDSGVFIKNVKVEIGTIPTDWTPAPEDIDIDIADMSNRISSAETTIAQNSEAITLRATTTQVEEAKNEAVTSANNKTAELLESYSTTSEMEAAIQLESNSIKSSVKSTYATKSDLSTTNNNVTTAQNTANGAQESIDNLSIGGRNYLLDSEYERECARATIDYTFVADLDWLKSKEGETVTLSFDAKGNEECDYQLDAYFRGDATTYNANNPVHTLTAEYARYSQVMVIPTISEEDSSVTIRIRGNQYVGNQTNTGNFYVKNVKLEFGNKATDWTPAKEEMATSDELTSVQSYVDLTEERVTTAESLIQQLSHSISMLVTDSNGESLMTQTESGWTFSTSEIQTITNTISENLDSLTSEMGDVNSTISVLQQAVDDLGILSEYVKITSYEDEPCIELGEGDSEFKLRITNTRMMFTEGSSVLAYFNNKSLHIKKAVVEEELQQGGFVWKARSNGNVGLAWKGGIN